MYVWCICLTGIYRYNMTTFYAARYAWELFLQEVVCFEIVGHSRQYGLVIESLKENSTDFAGFEERDGQYNTIWHKEVEAIEGAI